jgi:hypothetical protein
VVTDGVQVELLLAEASDRSWFLLLDRLETQPRASYPRRIGAGATT